MDQVTLIVLSMLALSLILAVAICLIGIGLLRKKPGEIEAEMAQFRERFAGPDLRPTLAGWLLLSASAMVSAGLIYNDRVKLATAMANVNGPGIERLLPWVLVAVYGFIGISVFMISKFLLERIGVMAFHPAQSPNNDMAAHDRQD